jgi:hypothetical protein
VQPEQGIERRRDRRRDWRADRLFHPRLDTWDDHFAWKGPVLVGRPAVGRVTVAVLDINHPERVRLRNLILGLGESLT